MNTHDLLGINYPYQNWNHAGGENAMIPADPSAGVYKLSGALREVVRNVNKLDPGVEFFPAIQYEDEPIPFCSDPNLRSRLAYQADPSEFKTPVVPTFHLSREVPLSHPVFGASFGRVANTARRLRGRHIVVHPPDDPDADTWYLSGKIVDVPLCRTLASTGASLLVENLPGRTFFSDLENVGSLRDDIASRFEEAGYARLLERVGICFDYGHFLTNTGALSDQGRERLLRDFFEKFGASVRYLHLHLNDGSSDQHLLLGSTRGNCDPKHLKVDRVNRHASLLYKLLAHLARLRRAGSPPRAYIFENYSAYDREDFYWNFEMFTKAYFSSSDPWGKAPPAVSNLEGACLDALAASRVLSVNEAADSLRDRLGASVDPGAAAICLEKQYAGGKVNMLVDVEGNALYCESGLDAERVGELLHARGQLSSFAVEHFLGVKSAATFDDVLKSFRERGATFDQGDLEHVLYLMLQRDLVRKRRAGRSTFWCSPSAGDDEVDEKIRKAGVIIPEDIKSFVESAGRPVTTVEVIHGLLPMYRPYGTKNFNRQVREALASLEEGGSIARVEKRKGRLLWERIGGAGTGGANESEGAVRESFQEILQGLSRDELSNLLDGWGQISEEVGLFEEGLINRDILNLFIRHVVRGWKRNGVETPLGGMTNFLLRDFSNGGGSGLHGELERFHDLWNHLEREARNLLETRGTVVGHEEPKAGGEPGTGGPAATGKIELGVGRVELPDAGREKRTEKAPPEALINDVLLVLHKIDSAKPLRADVEELLAITGRFLEDWRGDGGLGLNGEGLAPFSSRWEGARNSKNPARALDELKAFWRGVFRKVSGGYNGRAGGGGGGALRAL
ncbi:MAG: hypothetical protein ACTSU5_14760 [Promethearchaeota archaeon]